MQLISEIWMFFVFKNFISSELCRLWNSLLSQSFFLSKLSLINKMIQEIKYTRWCQWTNNFIIHYIMISWLCLIIHLFTLFKWILLHSFILMSSDMQSGIPFKMWTKLKKKMVLPLFTCFNNNYSTQKCRYISLFRSNTH